MQKAQIAHDADVAQARLRQHFEHENIHIKAHGSHLLIQMEVDGERDIVARLTWLDENTFGVAFRAHNKRWEPLPDQGTLDEVIAVVIENFGPYLMLDNY